MTFTETRTPLDAVLGDPRAEGADVVVVGGDAVPGARSLETLDRLNGLAAPVQWVRGNGEREVAAAGAGLSRLGSETEDVAASTAAVTAAELGAVRACELGGLPLTRTIDGVLFCHASRRNDAYDHVAAGRRMLDTGYPDVESIESSLIEPVEAIVVTRLFEQHASK